MLADLNVYLVNNILCVYFFSRVKSKASKETAKDLPDPLPPVNMKYLVLLSKTKYL